MIKLLLDFRVSSFSPSIIRRFLISSSLSFEFIVNETLPSAFEVGVLIPSREEFSLMYEPQISFAVFGMVISTLPAAAEELCMLASSLEASSAFLSLCPQPVKMPMHTTSNIRRAAILFIMDLFSFLKISNIKWGDTDIDLFG